MQDEILSQPNWPRKSSLLVSCFLFFSHLDWKCQTVLFIRLQLTATSYWGPPNSVRFKARHRAPWKWWSFIAVDVVTRCNQLMYLTKFDKLLLPLDSADFAAGGVTLRSQCDRVTKRHWRGVPGALWDTPGTSPALSSNQSISEWVNLLLFLLLPFSVSRPSNKVRHRPEDFLALGRQ